MDNVNINNNEYVIKVKFAETKAAEKIVSGDAPPPAETPGAETDTAEGTITALPQIVSFGAVKALADNIINFETNQVSLKTGAVEYEQQLKFGYSMANKLGNIGMATATGFSVGGVHGGALAFAGSTMYSFINYFQQSSVLSMQSTLEGMEQSMMMQRAGINGRRNER